MITLAALDIAGTTVDEGGAVYRVLADVVAEHGRPAPESEIRRWMGADKREALAALTGDAEAVERLHDRFVRRLRGAYADRPPAPLPGVPEAVTALRRSGIRVVLTTGFDRQVTDGLLAGLGWRVGPDLDGVVTPDEAGAGRPSPALVRHAMALTGVTDPREVLVAGDTVLDVRSGHAAGAGMVVAVLSGAQGREDLEPAGPTHVVRSVADLPALVGVPARA